MTAERYHRNTLLPGWNQSRLAEATVIIMGMGALGNSVAQSLALAGVERLVLCDMDIIETSNLSRAPLFRESDVGHHKVEAAAGALRRLVPGICVESRPDRLEYAVGLAELRDADLVLGCLDSRSARLALAGRCGLAGTPWIDGATGQWDGEIRPYLDPPEGPCFGCGLDEAARGIPDTPHSCRVMLDDIPDGAAAPMSVIVGAEMALLAVRRIMGLPVVRDILVLHGGSGQISSVQQKRDPTCPYHVQLPGVQKTGLSHKSTVGDLLARLLDGACPLAWKPFQMAVTCRKCGFSEKRVGRPESKVCPSCGIPLLSRTQMEIGKAPHGTELRNLGIASREILVVKQDNHLTYIELNIG